MRYSVFNSDTMVARVRDGTKKIVTLYSILKTFGKKWTGDDLVPFHKMLH